MEQIQKDDFLKNKPKQLLLKNYEIGEILGTGNYNLFLKFNFYIFDIN
jgi:hypothetical protein